MQARRRECLPDCLLMIVWLKCCNSSIRRDFSRATTAAVHTLLQLSSDPAVYRVDVRTVGWPEIGVMKSGVSPVKAIVCGEYYVFGLRLLRQQTSLPDQ